MLPNGMQSESRSQQEWMHELVAIVPVPTGTADGRQKRLDS